MSSKSHFFRGGINLIADYQFNNDLIDSVNGYDLANFNVTFNNANAVFNGSTSNARRGDTNDIFSFTDGSNDLPFRIETSIKFNSTTSSDYQVFANKRDGSATQCEWQLYYGRVENQISVQIFANGGINAYFIKSFDIVPLINTIYDIVVEYDASKTIDGLKIFVNGAEGTSETIVGIYDGMQKTDSRFVLGKFGFSSLFWFNGEMDYLKIYK